MKRSEINQLIRGSIEFFNEMNFNLPPWAFWTPDDWNGKYEACKEIVDNVHGWDLTDFGSGNFHNQGLILFTLRNGNQKTDKKIYAEKIMIVEENQETPMHFHWSKMEDIINRGGGNLLIDLYMSNEQEDFSQSDFEVKIDGISRTISAGESVILKPGESICLVQGMYHRFYGEKGKGKVLVGEVSAVNDDSSDNRFYDEVGRFPDIIEDEEPLHLLASDYKKYI
ncbi:MAG: D-lyxose/D-mannose family sugar isomerase [Bacteroidales bacterium]|nr:D-lyxose/D-mannose family sugar isomerase [Bacteroidales bacterium]